MKFSAFLALLAAPFNTLAQAKGLVDQALLQAKAIGEIFAKAALDADEIIAGGVDSLKTKIDGMISAAVLTAVTAKETELKGMHETVLTALKTEHISALNAALEAKDASLIASLATVGIKVDKFEKATVDAGMKARAEALGHELLAARGSKPLPEVLKDAGDVEAKNDLSTDAKILAAYEAMPAGPDRVAFLAKHEKAIWRAHSEIK